MGARNNDLTPSWCDRVAVTRCLAGRPVGRELHYAERVEVARRILAAGGTRTEVSATLHCNGPTARSLCAEVARRQAAKPAPDPEWLAELVTLAHNPTPTDSPERTAAP